MPAPGPGRRPPSIRGPPSGFGPGMGPGMGAAIGPPPIMRACSIISLRSPPLPMAMPTSRIRNPSAMKSQSRMRHTVFSSFAMRGAHGHAHGDGQHELLQQADGADAGAVFSAMGISIGSLPHRLRRGQCDA